MGTVNVTRVAVSALNRFYRPLCVVIFGQQGSPSMCGRRFYFEDKAVFRALQLLVNDRSVSGLDLPPDAACAGRWVDPHGGLAHR